MGIRDRNWILKVASLSGATTGRSCGGGLPADPATLGLAAAVEGAAVNARDPEAPQRLWRPFSCPYCQTREGASHACTRLIHSGTLASSTNPREIQRIEIRTERQLRQPERPVLHNSLDAWLDRPYNVAVSAFDIHPWRAWQQPRGYQNTEILALARKVEFAAMREGELGEVGNYWQGWAPVRATIDVAGASFDGQTDFLRTLSDRELSDKFQDNVGGLMDAGAATALEQRCWDLTTLPTTRQLTDLLPSTLPTA